MNRKIVIVGGVGGGATVAAQLRRQDKNADILLIDKGEHIAFSNCGMPYYIGGTVNKRKHLLVDTEKFSQKYNVRVQTNTTVTSIDRQNKQVICEHKSETRHEPYDKLILSPGASAVMPPFEGMNKDRTFTLHTIPDMDRIQDYIERHKPQSCAIIGAGFIGMEMVENLKQIGIDCTVIDRSKQVSKIVDSDMADTIEQHMQEQGVQIMLNEELNFFSENGSVLHLSSGKTVRADMTLMAAGIKPNTALATSSSLEIGETGAIKVNHFMQTNDPDIYALGDAVETNDRLVRTPRHIALAWPAHRQAYIIASHLHGADAAYNGTQGSAIFKVFDLTVGATGLNKAALDKLGINYQEVTHKARSHAGYYPGAEKVSIKILFDQADGTIYGAQVVGKDGADKRLAVLTTAMKGKLTVHDLPDLELAYAPPYSSPKDPINIIGYKAASMLKRAPGK
ncbi:CoA-disulfide reductase [Lentibacillus cibarius]|uniref:CoA-disulfide reductase n=1 Tax=Lentibacillus cibarius TaxID=2583219 RepID=A0A5S3QLK3_9BACI|nr:CoA-disulfide reductase [Lentibacillus cibarius]TMN22812.1 CoA-disulfide reductase [Lentibacillus cibarius]